MLTTEQFKEIMDSWTDTYMLDLKGDDSDLDPLIKAYQTLYVILEYVTHDIGEHDKASEIL